MHWNKTGIHEMLCSLRALVGITHTHGSKCEALFVESFVMTTHQHRHLHCRLVVHGVCVQAAGGDRSNAGLHTSSAGVGCDGHHTHIPRLQQVPDAGDARIIMLADCRHNDTHTHTSQGVRG